MLPGIVVTPSERFADEPAILVYLVNRLYDYSHTIVPALINGRKDEGCGRRRDWFEPAFK